MESLQNLLRTKLQETTLCGFKQPTSDVETHCLATRPSTNKVNWAFKYVYLLDKLKAASEEVLYNLINQLRRIFHESFYRIGGKNI